MAIHQLLIKDLVAEIDALVADVNAGTGDQLAHLVLRLPAERTLQVGIEFGHRAEAAVLRERPGGSGLWARNQDQLDPAFRQPSLRIKPGSRQ